MDLFNTHTILSGLAISGGFASWLYGKHNYGWIYDAMGDAKSLETSNIEGEDIGDGYYCIEGPVHSEHPIAHTNPHSSVNIVPTLEDEIDSYVRLDETVYCVLENSSTRFDRNEIEVCIGYMTNNRKHSTAQSVKEVKKSHTNSQIAYPITVNGVNIDEFVESIPLTYINRIFKAQNEMICGGEGAGDGMTLPKLSTKDLNSKLVIGFEFEKEGLPIASKVTIFGWYDSQNKRMKRRRGKGLIRVVDPVSEEDNNEFADLKYRHKPVIVTRSSKSDVLEHYRYLKNKWNGISLGGVMLGALIIGFKFLRK